MEWCVKLVLRIFVWIIIALCAATLLPRGGYARDAAPTKPAVKLTLEKCIALALAENQKMKAAGYGVEAAKGQLAEASVRMKPILDYEMRVAPVPTDVDIALKSFMTGSITIWAKLRVALGFPIYAFGAMTEAKRLAEGGVVAAKHKVVKEREKLIFDVKQIYYGILFGNEMRSLLQRAIDGLTNKIEGEEASDEPRHSPFELLKMKVFREELIMGLERTKVEMRLAYDGLRIQLGLPPNMGVELDRNNLEPEVVDLSSELNYVGASMAHRPDSKLIEIGVETKKRLWKLEKRKLAPRIGAAFFVDVARAAGDIRGITATDDFQNPLNYSRAGLGLQVKGRLDFYSAFGRIRKTRAEYLKALYEGQIGKRGLSLDAKKSYENAMKLKKKVMGARKQQSMANQMLFLSKTNYDLGIGDHKDYRDALEAVLGTRGQYFKTVFDYNVSLADLERKVGEEAYARLTGRPNIPVYEAFDDPDDDSLLMETDDEEVGDDEEYYEDEDITAQR